jgi:hypothetical protein
VKRTKRLLWGVLFLALAGISSFANAVSCGALQPGELLVPGQSVAACNGAGTLVHQLDGNVVFSDLVGPLWATGTAGRPTKTFVMQGDGNLVVYDVNNNPLWNSRTSGNPGAWLAVQNDCNLVIRSTAGTVLWASNTSCRTAPPPPPPPPTGGVKGKMIAGYQGWFGAPGDGGYNQWFHWGPGVVAPARVTFELYPDVREYPVLFQTGLANLGNGQPSKLFSSYSASTVNLHFHWMKQHNIDGVALQRFLRDRINVRTNIAAKVRNAAEANGRTFYIMYDVSGNNPDFVSYIQNDWTNTIVNSLQLTSSGAYAKEGGKPVVALWGIGFTDRPGSAQEWINLITWFKNRGVYVIGGVPWGWRTAEFTKPGFENVYAQLNMLSPWTVGLYSADADVDWHKNNRLIPDKNWCTARGIDYQPVAFPGFAWSNWAGGPRNAIPRRRGGLFWRQAYNIKSSGLSTMYVAMFDEYDEATAIAKAAENSSMIPTNQYFLTLDADGSSLSSDFYLRLAGAANRMLKGQTALTPTVPITNR